MNRHVTEWIPAYADGELHGLRLRQVEEHLESCAACRKELEALQQLSALLQEAPDPQPETSNERFTAAVRLRLPPSLPRPGAQASWKGFLKTAWQAAPLALVGGWALGQVILVLGSVGWLAWLGEAAPGQWAAFGLSLPGQAQTLMAGFPLLRLGVWAAGIGVLWLNLTFSMAVLMWGWLVVWWKARAEDRTRMNAEKRG